jgi:hypothetical protein
MSKPRSDLPYLRQEEPLNGLCGNLLKSSPPTCNLHLRFQSSLWDQCLPSHCHFSCLAYSQRKAYCPKMKSYWQLHDLWYPITSSIALRPARTCLIFEPPDRSPGFSDNVLACLPKIRLTLAPTLSSIALASKTGPSPSFMIGLICQPDDATSGSQ